MNHVQTLLILILLPLYALISHAFCPGAPTSVAVHSSSMAASLPMRQFAASKMSLLEDEDDESDEEDDDSDFETVDSSFEPIDFDDDARGSKGFDELDFVLSEGTAQKSTEPKQYHLNRLAIQAAKREWQRSENDSGSSEVQIAMLTERIIYMTKHLQSNPKDLHSRRGLYQMVSNRKNHLNYFFKQSPKKCMELCSALGIRFRPKIAVQSRESKYASFKNTKSKIGQRKRAELQTKALKERSKELTK